MPNFNSERFVRDAIESILNQTLKDFEFLIIDDGSTDGSAGIIASYGDSRIRLIANGTNLGVTASLNRGIDLAAGEYIARMDSDDISMPTRLAEQAAFLDKNPACSMVAVMVLLIDEDGRPLGAWADDRQNATSEEIRRFLPRANCLAHPGIMIRKSVLADYRYDSRQRVAQDYDLWLRLCADGLAIVKLAEPLLGYRVRASSVTARSKGRMPDLKNVRTKACFLRRRVAEGRLNGFCRSVFFAACRDLCYTAAKGVLSLLERSRAHNGKMEVAVMAPVERDLRIMAINRWPVVRLLVAVGKLVGAVLPISNDSSLFFFFPFFHVGGAERVHAEVVGCFSEQKPWVFFTKRSRNSKFRQLFPPQARLFTCWALLKYGYPLSVGILAGLVNRHGKAAVFGSNSLFYYLLLPYLKPEVRCIDLLHAFGGGAENFSLPVVQRLDSRVVINEGVLTELQDQYAGHGLDAALLDRVVLIENMVQLPQRLPDKNAESVLRVLYVGRSGTEKRVHLVGRTARRCREAGIAAEFTMVGDVETALDAADRELCVLRGEVADPAVLAQLYAEADLLLLTSSREGFPLVVMEAMAHGVIPVCTRVGCIERHVHHGVNGFLVENGDEANIIDDLLATLRSLAQDRDLLAAVSQRAYHYACTAFGPDKFCSAYRALIENPTLTACEAPCRK